jgi:hypothetical protein
MSTTFEEDVVAEEPTTRRLRPPPLPWVLFVIGMASAFVFYFLWQGERADEQRQEDVRVVATEFLDALTNFQGATIDDDVLEIREFAVGDFAQQVDQFFDEETVGALREAQARSVGDIRAVFVQSLGEGTASAFGVVEETVTNEASTTPRTELLRVDMQLIETTEGWKVSQVSILQSTSEGPFGTPSG